MPLRYVEALPELARERVSPPVFEYIAHGSGLGVTTAEAEQAWARLRFTPRILRDVTEVHLGASLLGYDATLPLGIAPTTLQRAVHPDGEVEMARAAVAAGVPMVVSSNAGSTFADIAATGVHWWLQMYVTADRSSSEPIIRAAVDAGAAALVLTADTPVVATKSTTGESIWEVAPPEWVRVNFPDGAEPDKAMDLGPHDIAWLADRFGLPVVVKGVLHPNDARRCIDAGAAAVWVSNHGGRQLDQVMSTAEALPAVAEAAKGSAEVYVDGGLRRGAHVLAALALGADAVFLGRPPLYALADGGAAGVRRLVDAMGDELEEALRLSGETDSRRVPRGLVTQTRPDLV